MLSEEEIKFHVQDNLNYVKYIRIHTYTHTNYKQWLFLDGRAINDTYFSS